MPASLENRLKTILERELDDGWADLETLSNGHVCGHVVSTEFAGCDYEDRRKRIRTVLNHALQGGELNSPEMLQVSTLLTYTPEEWSVASTNPDESAGD